MSKKIFLFTLLSIITVSTFAVERRTLFYEPFRTSEDPFFSNQTLTWGFMTGPGRIGNAEQWKLTEDLGYRVVTAGKKSLQGSFEPSAGYTGQYKNSLNPSTSIPSGGSVMEPRTWVSNGFAFYGIDTRKFQEVWFGCAMLGGNAASPRQGDPTGLKIEYSVNLGSAWQVLDWQPSDVETSVGTNGWVYVTFKKSLPSVENLFLRFTSSNSSNHSFIDDISVTGEENFTFDLRKTIGDTEFVLSEAVVGKELGNYLLTTTLLEQRLQEGRNELEKPYNAQDVTDAYYNLKNAYDAFVASKINTSNAPRIDIVPAKPFSFSNQSISVSLTNIRATGSGASITSVTAASKHGKAALSPVTGTGTNRSFTYTGVSGNYGKDTITVTVKQNTKPTGIITDEIQMSFAVEVLDASVNLPPSIDPIPNQHNVIGNNAHRSINLTGISPINPGQSIVSVTAVSDNLAVVDEVTINPITYELSYRAKSGFAEGMATITVTITDDAAGTTSGSAVTVTTFKIYVYDDNNLPTTFDKPEDVKILAGVETAQVIIPNIQNIENIGADVFSVEILSGAEFLNGTPTVVYNKENGDNFGIINVASKGNPGTAIIRVTLGLIQHEFNFTILHFSNPGVKLHIFDVSRFEQTNVYATGAIPIYEEIIGDMLFPTARGSFWWPSGYDITKPETSKWHDIFPRFLSQSCSSGACNPDPMPDLITLGFQGFFIPKTTGYHTFKFVSPEYVGGLFMDVTATSWKNAKKIAYSGNSGNAGTIMGNQYTSEEIFLEKGKIYPMYAVYFQIHQMHFRVEVKGPNDATFATIAGDMLAPLYDKVLPNAPTGVTINTVMATDMEVVWNKVVRGNAKVAEIVGYNLYVNGVKYNDQLLTNERLIVDRLTPGTKYQIFVTAVDELGNESNISNAATARTLIESDEKPGGNLIIREVGKTAQSIKVNWYGAIPPMGSAIVAYDVAMGGTAPENMLTSEYLFADSLLIRNLTPETEYVIYVRPYTASFVQGDWSSPLSVTTSAFDPMNELGLEFGEKRIALDIEMENLSWTEGIGVNGHYDYAHGPQNPGITALKPGVIRWGALSANMYGLLGVTGPEVAKAGDRATSVGRLRRNAGLPTHATNMNYANEIGAYYSLCIGMKQGVGGLNGHVDDYTVDYMEGVVIAPTGNAHNISGAKARTFRILFEYLAGPADSEGGRIRESEGFPEPLLTKDKSKGLLLEFGNEVWGGRAHNSQLGSNNVLYGQWCRNMTDSIRTLPFWDEIKDLVTFVYSVRSPIASEINTQVVSGDRGQITGFGVSGYLGGNMNYDPNVDYGETILQYYRLRHEQMYSHLDYLEQNMKSQIIETGAPLNSYFYETQASTSSYFGRFGQGLVLNDYLTMSFKYGSIVPALFVYAGGQWTITGEGQQPLAHYTIAQMVNTYSKGHVVKSNVRTNNKLNRASGQPFDGFDPVGTSVYNNGTRWSVLLFSRDFTNDYTVQINLPEGIGNITNAKRIVIAPDPTMGVDALLEFTRTEENVTLVNGQLVNVPKHSVVLYTFEANDPGFEKLPLGHYGYKKVTGLRFAGNNVIDVKNGNISIEAFVEPEDAFVKTVKWELKTEDNPNVVVFPLTNQFTGTNIFRVRTNVSNLCDGIYNLRASAASDPSISEIFQVTIENQGNNCRTSVENPYLNSVMLYPNPVVDILNVRTSVGGKATISIVNQVGATIMRAHNDTGEFQLNVSNLNPGVYFVRVEHGGITTTEKFIKK